MELLEDALAQLRHRLAREGNSENLFRLRDAAFCEQLEKPLQQQARLAGARRRFDDRRESHIQGAASRRMIGRLAVRAWRWNRGLWGRELKELRHRTPPRSPRRRLQSP
jgi:hypothetical protein